MGQPVAIAPDLAVILRWLPRARRLTLRVPRTGGEAVLTLPPGVSEHEALAFARSRADWLRGAVARRPEVARVMAGAVLPIEGAGRGLTPAPVRAAQLDGDRLLVPQARPVAPVVRAFLRHLAAERLRAACDTHAARLGRPYRALVLRDVRSRWGSCTTDGRLMFSWRLAMAPPEVLDYVAAHEVAHLAHMDHSPRFWATCAMLCPGYAPHRAWLKAEGSALMAWRFED